MAVSFDFYKIFYVTAKNKSITAAAKELYVTQPTVSHCIQKLEEELECTLFIRGKKGVELTPEGKILYEHAKVACEQLWQAEDAINQLKKYQKGEIALGASETTLHHFIFPLLKKYKQQYPEIHLKIYNSNTPGIIEAIRENHFDCGIVVCPTEYNEPDLELQRLSEIKDIMIVSREYKFLIGKPLSLKEICNYPLITLSSDTLTGIILRDYYIRHQLDYKPDIELATADLIVPAVENNLGIGIVPEVFAKEAIAGGRIFELDLIEKLPKRNICLIYKKGKPPSIAVDAFIRCINDGEIEKVPKKIENYS